jgi:hypothetical protein
MMRYFVCSAGEPGSDYIDWNFDNCVKNKAHILHEGAENKGAFDSVHKGSIIFLKYYNNLAAYGKVKYKENPSDGSSDGWNWKLYVEEWHFKNPDDKRAGADKYGISKNSLGAAPYDTVKEINPNWAIEKMKQIAPDTLLLADLLRTIEKEKNMEMITALADLLKANYNLVLTGTPGSGKTFLANEIARRIIIPPSDAETLRHKSIDEYVQREIDHEAIEKVDTAWSYWKGRILSDDFSIDDFANKKELVQDPYVKSIGAYIMNFLERETNIYGSSRPGNALQYGIKMNSDGRTYTVYDPGRRAGKHCDKAAAENEFNEKIRPWLRRFIETGAIDEKAGMIAEGNALIKANQLLWKIAALEHPGELLLIYQLGAIERAYAYFVHGSENDYFARNRALFTRLLEDNDLERNQTNQFNLSAYIWHYFGSEETAPKYDDDGQTSPNDGGIITEKYFSNYCVRTQFHPSYDYTDFVEGLRPEKDGGGTGAIAFTLRDGIFKSFCKKALEAWKADVDLDDSKKRKFVFIIDEINRGEIAKIFGELFFSIEPGYRGEEGKVTTQYSNLIPDEDCFKEGFFVPKNVYIIGTMNNIDRGVESFDFAMRRRFVWREITAAESAERMPIGEPVKKKMEALNRAIEDTEGLNASYQIGAAYFLKKNAGGKNIEPDMNELWELRLKPLISEYLRGMPDAEEKLLKLRKAFDLDSGGIPE